jgi:hypothetical protein
MRIGEKPGPGVIPAARPRWSHVASHKLVAFGLDGFVS